jgi:hypothetical protein
MAPHRMVFSLGTDLDTICTLSKMNGAAWCELSALRLSSVPKEKLLTRSVPYASGYSSRIG